MVILMLPTAGKAILVKHVGGKNFLLKSHIFDFLLIKKHSKTEKFLNTAPAGVHG